MTLFQVTLAVSKYSSSSSSAWDWARGLYDNLVFMDNDIFVLLDVWSFFYTFVLSLSSFYISVFFFLWLDNLYVM